MDINKNQRWKDPFSEAAVKILDAEAQKESPDPGRCLIAVGYILLDLQQWLADGVDDTLHCGFMDVQKTMDKGLEPIGRAIQSLRSS